MKEKGNKKLKKRLMRGKKRRTGSIREGGNEEEMQELGRGK